MTADWCVYYFDLKVICFEWIRFGVYVLYVVELVMFCDLVVTLVCFGLLIAI